MKLRENAKRVLAGGLGDLDLDAEIQELSTDKQSYLLGLKHRAIEALAKAEQEKQDIEIEKCDVESVENEAQSILQRYIAKMETLSSRVKKQKRFFEVFRTEHGLTRPADNPNAIMAVMQLGGMTFIEGGINSLFFSNANLTASPLSALLTAGLISFTNILASASAGYFFGRYLNYGVDAIEPELPEYKKKRRLARLGITASVAVLSLFHLTVGLVRSQSELEKIRHSLAAYLEIFTTPEAVFLVITGGVMSLLAYSKGKHSFADEYPNYSRFGDAVENAQDEFADICDEAKEEIEAVFDDAIDAVEKANKASLKRINKCNQAVEQAIAASQTLEHQCAEAKPALIAEIAKLEKLAVIAGSTVKKIPAKEIHKLTDFSSICEGLTLPEPVKQPNNAMTKAPLSEAKNRVLGTLAAHVQRLSETTNKPSK